MMVLGPKFLVSSSCLGVFGDFQALAPQFVPESVRGAQKPATILGAAAIYPPPFGAQNNPDFGMGRHSI